MPEITVAEAKDRARIIDTVIAAFAHDPVLRYLFPDDASYASGATTFFGYLFDKRVARGSVWMLGDAAAVAFWEPPGGGAAMPLPAALPDEVRGYNDAVHALMPPEPFWYLGVLATHPKHAGRGYGRAVMAKGIERAREAGVPAVLETSNPSNVELYQKAGWKVFATMNEPLPTWVMVC